MKKICNHAVFLTEDARNDLHAGLEVTGQGFTTIISMDKRNLDFTNVEELVTIFKINSNSKKTQVYLKNQVVNDLQPDNYISIDFNPQKLKINVDDILNYDNNGKEKINFVIMDKNSINYIVIADIKQLKDNYVFVDDINNSLEPLKI